MDISSIIRQIVILFIAIAIGYIANKAKILTSDGNRVLTKIVLNIAMPCTILDSVIGREVSFSSGDAFVFLGVAALAMVVAILVSWFLPKLLKTPPEEAGIFRFMAAFGNVGFMGYPLGEAIFGPESVFYIALFNIPYTLISYSVGIALVSGGKGRIDLRKFLNIPLIMGVITVIIFLLKIRMPAVVVSTVSMFAKVTTPGAMLVTGSTLAMLPFKEVFLEKRMYVVSFVKLILLPVVTFFLFRLFISDKLMLGVATVLMATPIATNSTMLAMEYGGDEKLGSKGIFVSTLLSAATVPILVSLLLM